MSKNDNLNDKNWIHPFPNPVHKWMFPNLSISNRKHKIEKKENEFKRIKQQNENYNENYNQNQNENENYNENENENENYNENQNYNQNYNQNQNYNENYNQNENQNENQNYNQNYNENYNENENENEIIFSQNEYFNFINPQNQFEEPTYIQDEIQTKWEQEIATLRKKSLQKLQKLKNQIQNQNQNQNQIQIQNQNQNQNQNYNEKEDKIILFGEKNWKEIFNLETQMNVKFQKRMERNIIINWPVIPFDK